MTLSAPAPRRHLHTRTIHCQGFQREDGLWDIEARIVDTKTYPYTEPYRGLRQAGDEVHDMAVRLTLDTDMEVRAIEVSMPATPYPTCGKAEANYQRLIGTKIGAGWRRAVQEALGAARGCTHVRELLFPMATVAFQTLGGWREDGGESREAGKPIERSESLAAGQRPYYIGGCVGWATDGEVVARLHPEFASAKV